MEVNEANLGQLAVYLQQTLSPQAEVGKRNFGQDVWVETNFPTGAETCGRLSHLRGNEPKLPSPSSLPLEQRGWGTQYQGDMATCCGEI